MKDVDKYCLGDIPKTVNQYIDKYKIDYNKLFSYDCRNVKVRQSKRKPKVPGGVNEGVHNYDGMARHIWFIYNLAVKEFGFRKPIILSQNKYDHKIAMAYVIFKYCNPPLYAVKDIIGDITDRTLVYYLSDIRSGKYDAVCKNFECTYLHEIIRRLKEV